MENQAFAPMEHDPSIPYFQKYSKLHLNFTGVGGTIVNQVVKITIWY